MVAFVFLLIQSIGGGFCTEYYILLQNIIVMKVKKKKKIHCDHSFPISFVATAFGKLAAASAEVQSGM